MTNPFIISENESKYRRKSIHYQCHTCGEPKKRSELFARRIQWLTMGNRSKVVRGRVLDWMCQSCMEADPLFQRVALGDSPGYQDTLLGRQYVLRQPDPTEDPE